MKLHRKILLKILLVVFMLAAPTSAVLANSLPAPFQMWLTFVSDKNRPISVEGLQLIGCGNSECTDPQLLKEYGVCNSTKCFADQPILSDQWKLDCAGNRCLFETRPKSNNSLPPYMKLVITSSSDTWVSDTAAIPECNSCEFGLKALLGEDNVTILPDAEFAETSNINKESLTAYLISVSIEMAVAGLILWMWKKKWTLTIKKGVGIVMFANLLSFPISWVLIPSFGRFAMETTRQSGFFRAIMVVVVLLIGLWVNKNQHRIKKWMVITAAFLLPLIFLLFLVIELLLVYGSSTRYISGLPPSLVIALAETFAVAFETLIIYLFCKENVSLKQALLLSLATNAVSFGVSLFLYN